MHYYIDGYNVTRRDPATRELSLEAQRAALEGRLRAGAGRSLGKGGYTVVWDGAGGEGVVRKAAPHVAFTRRPTADDAIVERVRGAKERVGVVTSDRGLAERCRAVAPHGADVLPAERLFAQAGSTSKKRKGAPLSRDVGIPANANEINRELKKIWGIED